MSDSFTVEEAGVIGMFMEALLYGSYIISLGYCLHVLLCRSGNHVTLKSIREVNWWLLGVVMLMAIILTLDLVLFLRYNLVAFIRNGRFDGPAAAFSSQKWIKDIRNLDYVALTAIGDAILIYRVYRLYDKRFLIILPAIVMYLTDNLIGILMVVLGIATDVLAASKLEALEFTFFSLTVVLNIFATSLLIIKLWRTRARVSAISSNPDKLLVIIRIMLDSGLLYTLSTVVLMCTLPSPNLADCVSDATIQIIGIAFNLIIIRLHTAMHGSSSAADDDAPTIVPRSSGIVRRSRTVVDSESPTPLATFEVVADKHADLRTDKSIISESDGYGGTWKRGFSSTTDV